MRGAIKVVLLLAALGVVAFIYLLIFPISHAVPGFAARENTKNDLLQLRSAVQDFTVEYGYPPPADPAKLLKILRGEMVDGYNWKKREFMHFRGPERRFWLITSPGGFNARGEMLDGWGAPYIWQQRPPGGQLAVWSRLKFQRGDREMAEKRGFYAVIIE